MAKSSINIAHPILLIIVSYLFSQTVVQGLLYNDCADSQLCASNEYCDTSPNPMDKNNMISECYCKIGFKTSREHINKKEFMKAVAEVRRKYQITYFADRKQRREYFDQIAAIKAYNTAGNFAELMALELTLIRGAKLK